MSERRIPIICLGLCASVLAVYAQIQHFEFIDFDDLAYIVSNAYLQRGLSFENLIWSFTTTDMANWHPLTWLSYMLDYELFGLQPGGYHLSNLLLHVANSLLLFGAFQYMTRQVLPSALLAALFALHPLRVESVAWIAERKDVLSAAFGLLSLWTYAVWTRSGGWARYSLAAGFLALGLMAKPMLVTLPLVFLLLDFWPLRRLQLGAGPAARGSFCGALIEKLPLLALSGAACIATLIAQEEGGSLRSAMEVPFSDRIANALVSYVRYLRMTFWPTDLAIHYPHPYLPEVGGEPFPVWQVAGAFALLAAISATVIRERARPHALVGWLWYLGMLVPVIGLIQVGRQGLADRYTYLPQIGLFVALVWSGHELVTRLRVRHAWVGPTAVALSLLAVASCMALSRMQLRHWQTSVLLFQHAIAVSPTDSTSHQLLGDALLMRGRVQESIPHFRRALEIGPDWDQPHMSLGIALMQQSPRNHHEASDHFLRAVETQPAEAHYNLGLLYQISGDPDRAIRHYRDSLRVRPNHAGAHNNLGLVLQSQGAGPEAVTHYREALRIDPHYENARRNLEAALAAGMESKD